MCVFSFGFIIGRYLIVCLLTGFCFNAAIYGNTPSLGDLLIPSTAQSFESSWLEDYLPDDYQDNTLQYLQAFNWQTCPPIPDEIIQASCFVSPCTNETECPDNQQCCSNGCVFTCSDKVEPPAVIDWLREPIRKRGGTSWLIDGNDTEYQTQECSTSVFSGIKSAMLCPQGFTCKIEDHGNPSNNIPNIGICIAHNIQPQTLHQPAYEGKTDGEKLVLTGCQVHGKHYDDNEWFTYEKRLCKCGDGSVLCNVKRRRKHHREKTGTSSR